MNWSGIRRQLPCLLRWPPHHEEALVEHTRLDLENANSPHNTADAIRVWRCQRCGRERVSAYLGA